MKIGIDLGASHIGIGVVSDEANIIESFEKYFSDKDKQNIITIIEEYISETVTKLKEKYAIESIGLAIPGSVKNGIIVKTTNLKIANYNIKESLEKKLGFSVFTQNDGKCACIAEYSNLLKKGSISSDDNMLFLNIGTGIGGGMIYNGKLLEGKNFEGYEFGHMVIKENGVECNCGKKGCFEKYGNILDYKNKVKERLKIDSNINGDKLREIMDSRKSEIEDIKNIYVQDLALGLSNLINIFEPDITVLGGGFANFAYMFIDEIKNSLTNSALLFNKRNSIDIRIAELENNAGIIGSTQIKS